MDKPSVLTMAHLQAQITDLEAMQVQYTQEFWRELALTRGPRIHMGFSAAAMVLLEQAGNLLPMARPPWVQIVTHLPPDIAGVFVPCECLCHEAQGLQGWEDKICQCCVACMPKPAVSLLDPQ